MGDEAMKGQGGSLRSPASKRQDRRPTPDELYLAQKLNGDAFDEEVTPGHRITIPAIQKWNVLYGVERTTAALRTAWGFPPLLGIDNPFSYVAAILKAER
jgi:hypothetical protein